MASILIGILTGVFSFAAALVAGQGFVMAFGFYILGGIAGVVAALAVVALRAGIRRHANAGGRLIALRG
jgi:uncharacterized membrane protein YuzA (DUF378 family)